MSFARSFKASSQGSKSASGAVAKSACAASQGASDRTHHAAAAVTSWMSKEKNSYVIQMKRKLKSLPRYKKEADENQLTSEAKRLISVDELYCDFSHLIQDTHMAVLEEATQFLKLNSQEEREAAKEREQMRFDRAARLKLTVCLSDISAGEPSIHKDRTVISTANFLKMEYSGKHAAVLVDDVLLEWDDGNVIIPRRVSGEDKFIFEADVNETGEYFNRIAEVRPQLHDEPKTPEDEGDILCRTLTQKLEFINQIIAVVVEYNKAYYYNSISRNCQHFVQAVLKAAKIRGRRFSTENEEYLKLVRQGKMRVPQSFRDHQAIDSFVTNSRDKNGLKSLNQHELIRLKKAYETHHGNEQCTLTTCPFDEVVATLYSKQNP